MKILVVSDSHSGLRYMVQWAGLIRPDVMIHLGDYYDDGQVLGEEFPGCRLIQVPGNCDRWRCMGHEPEIVFAKLDGVGIYLTHGHRHGVKSGTGPLLAAAREAKADIVLYGHTHVADCYRAEDGLWVMNPGSCGSSGGSVGLLEIQQGKILRCRVLCREDMEEFE